MALHSTERCGLVARKLGATALDSELCSHCPWMDETAIVRTNMTASSCRGHCMLAVGPAPIPDTSANFSWLSFFAAADLNSHSNKFLVSALALSLATSQCLRLSRDARPSLLKHLAGGLLEMR